MSNPPTLHLYYSPGACSLAPHITLNELSLPFTTTHQKMQPTPHPNGSLFAASFRAINPKMRVPVLRLNDTIITEAIAILTALSDLAPEKKLFGDGLLERAKCYEWLAWLSGTVHGQGFGGLWRAGRFTGETGAEEGVKRKGRETVVQSFGDIEGGLRDGEWAVGGGFTVVDAFLLVIWRWAKGIGEEMGEYPRWTGLVERVRGRESVRRALAAEGLDGVRL